MSFVDNLVKEKLTRKEIDRQAASKAYKLSRAAKIAEYEPWMKSNKTKIVNAVKKAFKEAIAKEDYYYLHKIELPYDIPVESAKIIGKDIEKNGFDVGYDYCHDGYESYDHEGSSNGWVHGGRTLFVHLPFKTQETLIHG